MTVYGYCRVSTQKQSIERQRRNIKAAFPAAVLLEDEYTGTKIEGRKSFEKLLKILQPGDVVVFDSVSRMSRNAAEGFTLYKKLFDDQVQLVFLKEPHINTEVYRAAVAQQIQINVKSGDQLMDQAMTGMVEVFNKLMLGLAERQIQLAFDQSEKEVQDLRQRTREGIVTAKINGKQIGAVDGKRLHTKKEAAAKAVILKHSKDFNGSLADPDVITLCGCSRNSYYKYKAELKAEAEA